LKFDARSFFSLVFFHGFLQTEQTFTAFCKISSVALAEVLRPTQRQWEVSLGSSIDRHGEAKWPRSATGVLPQPASDNSELSSPLRKTDGT